MFFLGDMFFIVSKLFFFIVSKLFEFLAAPVNFALFLGALGWGLTLTRCQRLGRALGGGALVLLLVFAFSPLATLIATPLEARFPSPPQDAPAPDGVIVLGGSVDENLSARRNPWPLWMRPSA